MVRPPITARDLLIRLNETIPSLMLSIVTQISPEPACLEYKNSTEIMGIIP